jgi:hypothetical protein
LNGSAQTTAYARALYPSKEVAMTLCPIALVASCKQCPAFSVCPLKSVIGDVPKPDGGKSAGKPETKKK